jgi:Rod binding domain-containing protein
VNAAALKSAQEFEGMMIAQMLEPMWAGLSTDGAFGGGVGEQVFRSMMVQEIGRSIAQTNGIGLADGIARSLLAAQEARP